MLKPEMTVSRDVKEKMLYAIMLHASGTRQRCAGVNS